jgi:hypothetical protein
MDELIARLEAATGPDRELDEGIHVVFGHCLHPFDKWQKWEIEDGNDYDSGINCGVCGKDTSFNPAPAYTSSIDAAVTLVPEDMHWEICRADHRKGFMARVWYSVVYRADAPTPALALCIAALKARKQP